MDPQASLPEDEVQESVDMPGLLGDGLLALHGDIGLGFHQ